MKSCIELCSFCVKLNVLLLLQHPINNALVFIYSCILWQSNSEARPSACDANVDV